ncbi:hypothetical protein [Microbacterium sp. P03]|uniref:hypothetical protein n=1 Tax=Microbacterium sp. P03 TaxID=3366946 RepID=UPI0037454D2B
MKSLTTRVGTYATGDLLADAVMSYSLALARQRKIDLVDIPFRESNGKISNVQLAVGWMANLDAVGLTDLHPEVADAAVTADLLAREDALQAHGDTAMSANDFDDADGLRDY